MKILLSMIKPSQFQVRSKMDDQPISDLKSSISEIGLAVPIKVRPSNGEFELVYGHRRLDAAKSLGWEEIDVIVEELTDEEAMKHGLAENIVRDDLEPLDEARAYRHLIDDFGWSWSRISKEMGIPPKRINATLKLLELPDKLQEKVENLGAGRRGASKDGEISRYHVEEAEKAGDHYNIIVVEKASKEGLSVAQTRLVAKAVKEANTDKLKQQLIDAPFSEHVHDPERVKKIVEGHGGIDPLTDNDKPKPKQHEKAVADFLRYIKQMRWWLEDFEKAIDNEQISPEGRPFVSERLKPMRSDINRILTKLEK